MESDNMKQQASPMKKKKYANVLEDDGDSSDWSLASLQDMKQLTLKEVEEGEEMGEKERREKKEIEVKFPPQPDLTGNLPMHEMGVVEMVVGELLIVGSKAQQSLVVDLDSWVCGSEGRMVGFVMDVLGKIEQPFYAVRPQDITQIGNYLGKTLYYIEGASKILKDEDIQSLKSKSVLQNEQDDDDSDDCSQRMHRDFDEERSNRPERRNKFRQEMAPERRQRTRDWQKNNRRANRSRSQHNQRYLDNLYAQHYAEMARLQGGGEIPRQPYKTIPQSSIPISGQHPIREPPQMQAYNQNYNQPFPQHNNIASFGSNPTPGLFFGQNPPSNYPGQPPVQQQQTGQSQSSQPSQQQRMPYPWLDRSNFQQ